MRAGFCARGGFVAQWFMVALVRHSGFESRSCWYVYIENASRSKLIHYHYIISTISDNNFLFISELFYSQYV